MKELTYEDWKKNPTPREMWVWDDSDYEGYKTKRIVIYMLPKESKEFNVIALMSPDSNSTGVYQHCAEIEEPKKRRMTNQELAWWIREKPTREYIYSGYQRAEFEYSYFVSEAKNPVPNDVLIREDGGEWREPLVEVEE